MYGSFAQLIVRVVPGSRCSASAVVWSLVGCLLLLHLYSNIHHKDVEGGEVQLRISHHPQLRELQEVEEENIQVPPPKGKRSPRAAKRRPKRTTTLIDEFLDENSQLRPIFFPDKRRAIDPMKDAGNDSYYYYPGRIWLDTDGNPIQAHGGGILYDRKSRTYYWYGEYKDGPTYHAHKKASARVDIIGVGCYSSKDLWTWKNEGIVLAAVETNETHDLHKSNVLERPKVIYNEKTGKYVMWMHIDDANYTKAAVGVAISDAPDGPFDYLGSQRPHGYESRDMTLFKDDDGVAYLIYSSEDNSELHIGPLTEDYLNVTSVMRRILVGQHREAPALFKHQGTYYMITSGCTGWAPNEALAHAAESILGPWETMGNPCIGGNKMFRLATFFAQSTFVLPLPTKTEANTSHHTQIFHYPLIRPNLHQQHQHGGGETSNQLEAIKAKITAHPQYSNLLEAYMDCQKVGAPPEVVARLAAARQEFEARQRSSASSREVSKDPELDQFMEAYYDMLVKYREELTRPIQEAMDFMRRIETQLNMLCNGPVRIFSDDKCDGVGSSEEDQDNSGGETELPEIDPRAEDRELKTHLLRKYSGYLGSLKQELSKKKKKGKLPKDARQKLLSWWELHYKWPYPSESEKVALAESTGLDQKQINNWFINQRKRHWKPSEDMQFMVMDGLHPQNATLYMDGHYMADGHYRLGP